MTEESSARNRIKDAYLAFMRDKPYNKIKVSDIINAAGISRSTFYRNFEDVYALYNAVCEDIITDVLLDVQEDFHRRDMRLFVEAISEKVLRHADKIQLVAGKNGNKIFVFRLRNSFYESLRRHIMSAEKWDDTHRYFVHFSADYLSIVLCDAIRDNAIEYNTFRELDFSYDFDLDPVDNICEALRVLNGGSKDVQTAFFLSVVRFFSAGDSRKRPITELLSYSGFSRTEFYKFYSHKQDYFNKIGNALYVVTIKSLLPLFEKNDPHAFEIVLDSWDKYYTEIERNALIKGMRSGYLLELWTDVFLHLYAAYMELLEEKNGGTLDESTRKTMSFFICSAGCCFLYYMITEDREMYFRNIEALYDFKKRMTGQ